MLIIFALIAALYLLWCTQIRPVNSSRPGQSQVKQNKQLEIGYDGHCLSNDNGHSYC